MNMLKNLFSKDGRETLKIAQQYENCKVLRRRVLGEIKRSTIEDIGSVFHEPVFIFSPTSAEFFAVSTKGEAFFEGELENNIEDVTKYFRDENFHQNLNALTALDKRTIQRVEHKLLNHDFSNRLMADYFSSAGNRTEKTNYKYWRYDLNELMRLTVTKNGKVILRIDPLKMTPVSDVMQTLHNGIVHHWIDNGANGISRLDIDVDIFFCVSEKRQRKLSIFYDDRKLSPTNNNREHLHRVYNQTVPLVSSIASYMNKTKYDNDIVRIGLQD